MFDSLFTALKLRYFIIFHYGSKKTKYVLLKTLCILIFIIPFCMYGLFNFVLGIILLIPSFIPIIGLAARFICFISESIHSIFFMLITLPDAIFESENMQLIETLNDIGDLK